MKPSQIVLRILAIVWNQLLNVSAKEHHDNVCGPVFLSSFSQISAMRR